MMEGVEDSVAAMEDNFAKALKRIERRLESLETLASTNYSLVSLSHEHACLFVYTGLKIIFERWPVVLTDQTNLSSAMSPF